MKDIELADNIAKILKTAREDADLSQEQIAKSLNISKTTVQNWEKGFKSPNFLTILKWFNICEVQPLSYFLNVLYPEHTADADLSEEQITDAIIDFIKALPLHYKQELFYQFYGEHGSSPLGILELATAHLQVPLRDRLNIAQSVIINYEVSEAREALSCPQDIQPDLDILKHSLESGTCAVKNGQSSYSNIK